MKSTRLCSLAALGLFLILTGDARGQSTVTTYQGQLKSSGAPANGNFDFAFRLCSSAAGPGGVLQTFPPGGTVAVEVAHGLFTQELAFDAAYFSGEERWLEIEVDGTTLSPRQHLTYTPYAIAASTLILPYSGSANLPAPGCVFSVTSTGAAPAICGDNTAASGFTCGVSGTAASPDGTGVCGTAAIGVQGTSTTPNGNGVVGYASGGPDAWAVGGETATGQAVIGRAGSSPPGGGFPPVTGVVGYSNGASGMGVFGQSTDTFGRGVYGLATNASGPNYGVYGESSGTFGSAVYGEHTATSGLAYGGRFQTRSTDGRAVRGWATALTGTTYGGHFVSDSNTGYGVYGLGGGGLGTSYGVYGQSTSRSGIGVYGLASDSTTSNNYGAMGESRGTFGRGVVGWATATTGATFGMWAQSDSTSGTGVYGYASAGTGTIYGVYGQANTAAAGYAVYANGDMGASGIKPFRIDHPDDPANKYLLHYAAESPEVINFYRGTVALDGTGEAVVQLPHYFAKVNKDPSYVLTAVGAPMPMLHVAEEIDEAALSAGAKAGPGEAVPVCSFRIAGGAPGAKVSWRVEAVRNDLWVQQRGAPVELEKEGREKGTYQHPELYGQPPELGMNYDAEHERPSAQTEPDPSAHPARGE